MVAAYMSGIQPSKTFYLLLQLSLKKAEKYMPNNRSVDSHKSNSYCLVHYCDCKGTIKLQLLQHVFQRMLTYLCANVKKNQR